MAGEPKRYATLEDVQKDYRTGYALKHMPTALFDDYEYYTWHRTKEEAWSFLKAMKPIADEKVIAIGGGK